MRPLSRLVDLGYVRRELPFARGREVVPVLWARRAGKAAHVHVQTPDDVLNGLR